MNGQFGSHNEDEWIGRKKNDHGGDQPQKGGGLGRIIVSAVVIVIAVAIVIWVLNA